MSEPSGGQTYTQGSRGRWVAHCQAGPEDALGGCGCGSVRMTLTMVIHTELLVCVRSLGR
jgi:hypothetical protein